MESDFNLRELGFKVKTFNRQNANTNTNTMTRRFSASRFNSFREDERFIRSTPTISSTVSSPGYTTADKIDPSTYSFTAALRAIQGKERLSLQSKWSDAEKYISNPLSGEVPLECLSAKTLSARSFSTLTNNKITIKSAPLLYPSNFQTKFPIMHHHHHKLNITIQEKKRSASRDVGVQSTPADLDVAEPPTPPIEERSRKVSEGSESVDSCDSTDKEKLEQDQKEVEVERETKEKEDIKAKQGGRCRERKKVMVMMTRMAMRCSHNQRGGGGRRRIGCLPLKGLWGRDKNCKPRINNKPSSSSSSSSSPTYLFHINACYDD